MTHVEIDVVEQARRGGLAEVAAMIRQHHTDPDLMDRLAHWLEAKHAAGAVIYEPRREPPPDR